MFLQQQQLKPKGPTKNISENTPASRTSSKLSSAKPVEKEATVMAVEAHEHASSSAEKPKKSAGNGHHAINGKTAAATNAKTAGRVCPVAGCAAPLASTNLSGFCQHHFHRSDRGAKNGAHKNGAPLPATVKAGNGGAELGLHRGDLTLTFKPDRLDRLFLSLPVEEKAKLAGAWLRGVI